MLQGKKRRLTAFSISDPDPEVEFLIEVRTRECAMCTILVKCVRQNNLRLRRRLVINRKESAYIGKLVHSINISIYFTIMSCALRLNCPLLRSVNPTTGHLTLNTYPMLKKQQQAIKIIRVSTLFFGLFRLSSFCFGSIETPKRPVSILNRNNRNKRLVSDSFETSFGSIFGCFESKLVSQDTLLPCLP
jgi:hypothetical protein